MCSRDSQRSGTSPLRVLCGSCKGASVAGRCRHEADLPLHCESLCSFVGGKCALDIGAQDRPAFQASCVGSFRRKRLAKLFRQKSVANTNPSGDRFHQKSVRIRGSCVRLWSMAPQEAAES